MGGSVNLMAQIKASSRQGAPIMGASNASLEAIRDLHFDVFRDVADQVDYYDVERDIETLKIRYRQEGFPLLSKTLPQLGDAIFSSLYPTGILSQTFFKRARRKNIKLALPSFCLGLLKLVFDCHSGEFLPDASYTALAALRQICYFTYKYEVPVSDAVKTNCFRELIEVDGSLPSESDHYTWLGSYPVVTSDFVLTKAKLLLDQLFEGVDMTNIIPRHGPGASSVPLKQYEKFNFRHYSASLGSIYPYASFCSASLDQARDDFEGFVRIAQCDGEASGIIISAGKGLEPIDNVVYKNTASDFEARCSKVSAVPKTSRGPRIISAEPVGNQWIQQGQNKLIVDLCESHPLTKGRVNFSNQTINQQLALKGSLHGTLSTIDQSSASDRVSYSLVKALMPPHVFRALDVSRSCYTSIKWPTGNTSYFKLKKFAPMGSGVCFSVESVVFWALTVATIEVYYGESKSVALESVYVYGDDVIVPTHFAEGVLKMYPNFSLKINEKKTLTRGLFRESCGLDAYAGVDITPLRLKSQIPLSRGDVDSLVGWIDFGNELFARGYLRAFNRMKTVVESILGQLPWIPYKTDVLGWIDSSVSFDNFDDERVPEDVQRPYYQGKFVQGWVMRPKRLTPTEAEFPEKMAQLRWAVESSLGPTSDPFSVNSHRLMMRQSGSARVFAYPYSVNFHKGKTILT